MYTKHVYKTCIQNVYTNLYRKTIYITQCIQNDVYKTMYTKQCIQNHVYKTMYTKQCIQNNVYKTIHTKHLSKTCIQNVYKEPLYRTMYTK